MRFYVFWHKFVLFFPQSKNMEEKMETKKQKVKILIADASEDARNELVNYFSKSDRFEIVGSSSNGQEVLDTILNNSVDVVVMDVVLTGIDGFEVLEEAKKHPNISSKFIIESNLTHDGFVTKATMLGANYFIAKPINCSIVEKRVLELVENKAPSNISKMGGRQLEEKISNIFITVGIPAHIKGYQFLREAIKLAIDSPEIINSITKKLYPTIADKYSTSSSKVERAIRHAIEVAWNRGKIENINSIFGLKVYNSNEKPTNGEFIALVADKMLIEGA